MAEAAFLAGGGSFEVSDSAFFANRLDVRGTIFLAADDVAQRCMPLIEESMVYGRSTLAMGFVLLWEERCASQPDAVDRLPPAVFFFRPTNDMRIKGECIIGVKF